MDTGSPPPPFPTFRDEPADLRQQRRAAGWNASSASVLAVTLAVLMNLIGARLYFRMPVATHLYGELTERTLQVLGRTEGDLELIAFFENGHPLAAPVRALLQEFAEASRTLPNLRIRTRVVDPNRDVAIAADLSRRFAAEANTLLIQTRSSHRIITPDELVIEKAPDSEELRLADFAGESAVAAAIWNATRAGRPTLYFLSGNGEHDPLEYDRLNGYSSIARHLRRDRYDLRKLALDPGASIPSDCSLLVIAGPRTHLGNHALEQIGTYLASGGRLFLMLDRVTDPGLRAILEDWGILALPKPAAQSSGAGHVKASHLYGHHPITRGLARVEVSFESPSRLMVSPEALNVEHADKPRASVLLSAMTPFRMTSREDTGAGVAPNGVPHALAVASERGPDDESDRSYLARIVVVGDAQFASNAMIDGGLDGNRDFFLSAVHWLTEQDVLIGRMPVTFRILRPGIASRGWLRTTLLVAVLWPLGIWVAGLVLTHSRRRGV